MIINNMSFKTVQDEERHCPFCVSSLLQQTRDKPLAVIALDLDGTLVEHMSVELHEKVNQTIKKKFPEALNRVFVSPYQLRCAMACHLNPEALTNLRYLIDTAKKTYDVGILLISAWRHCATLQQIREEIFKETQFGAEIIGKTLPSVWKDDTPECHELKKQYKDDWDEQQKILEEQCFKDSSRADQITTWFKMHNLKLNETKFVIFDDYNDDLSRFPNFVHVRDRDLLSKDDVTQALKILGITTSKG